MKSFLFYNLCEGYDISISSNKALYIWAVLKLHLFCLGCYCTVKIQIAACGKLDGNGCID
jgi:hypothetical protein